jgi:hypothetical protein
MNDTTKNMATLEQLLSDVRDRAGIDPAIADVMREAVMICQTGYTVRAGMNLQLQGALNSLRAGHPEDAARFIEVAIGIQDRWAAS